MLLSRHAAAVLAAGALRPADVAGAPAATPRPMGYGGVDPDPAWAPDASPAVPDPATLPLFDSPEPDDDGATHEPTGHPDHAIGTPHPDDHATGRARAVRSPAPVAMSRRGPTDRPRRGVRPARRAMGARHGARPGEVSVAQREREILALVRTTGPLTVDAIAQASSCGESRIRAILANLVDVGALARAPQWNPLGGRPTYLYYDPDAPDQVREVATRTARPSRDRTS